MFKKLFGKLFGKKETPEAPKDKKQHPREEQKSSQDRPHKQGQHPRDKQKSPHAKPETRDEKRENRSESKGRNQKPGGDRRPNTQNKNTPRNERPAREGENQSQGRQENQSGNRENREKRERQGDRKPRMEKAWALTALNHSHPDLKVGCKVHIRQVLDEGMILKIRGEGNNGAPVNVTCPLGHLRQFEVTGVPFHLRKFYKTGSLWDVEEEAVAMARNLSEKAPEAPVETATESFEAEVEASLTSSPTPVADPTESLWDDEAPVGLENESTSFEEEEALGEPE